MSPSVWVNVIALAATWACSAAFTYGLVTAELRGIAARVDKLEKHHEGLLASYVSRSEYESRHQDILRRLDRIEGKLDAELSRR